MNDLIKAAYWDTLEAIVRETDDKDLMQIMSEVEKTVDAELLKQMKEANF